MKNFHVDKCSYRMLFLVAACCVADLNHRERLLICHEAGGTLLLERARAPRHTRRAPCADTGGCEEEQEVAELKSGWSLNVSRRAALQGGGAGLQWLSPGSCQE